MIDIDEVKKLNKDPMSYKDDMWGKVSGTLEPGSKVKIVWRGRLKGCVDFGYVFILPYQYWNEGDMIVHIPKHMEEKGSEEAIWIHLWELLDLPEVKKITKEE